jgi:1,4-dihydroxy-2-naphthoate octaprenyltransferase
MIKEIITTTRPKTLIASIAPIFTVGAYLFDSAISHFSLFVCILFATITVQILTNFYNDYFDLAMGHDTEKRKGPKRPYQMGKLTKANMHFCIAFFTILYVVFLVPIIYAIPKTAIVLGILSYLLAIFYSYSRFSLSKLGLSDLFSFLFFGPIATQVTGFALTNHLDYKVILLGLITGSLSTMLLVINHLRDKEEDQRNGKTTTVVRFGEKFGMQQIMLLINIVRFAPVVIFPINTPNIIVILVMFFLAEKYIKRFIKAYAKNDYAPMLPVTALQMFIQTLLLVLLCGLHARN